MDRKTLLLLMIFIGVLIMKPADAEWFDLSPNPFEEIYQQSQSRTDGFIGDFIPSNEIIIEQKTYFGEYIDFEFNEVNNTHWLVNFSVNQSLLNDIRNCLKDKTNITCWKVLCKNYLDKFLDSMDLTCGDVKNKVLNEVENLKNWKLIGNEHITFDRNSINYTQGTGSFYIIFPNGFKENLRANLGNLFDPEVTMIPNPANGTTYNGTIAETTHPAVTAGTAFVGASYNLVNTSNDQYAGTTGSATVDAYVRTNFYLPQSIYYLNWIYVTVELKNTANADALHLALYNYTSGLFVDVNTTASSTTDKNLTFNISGSNITAFVDYRNMNVLTHLSGTSSDNLNVDYVSVLVSYNIPNSPIIINTGTTVPFYPNQRAICKDGVGNLHVVWQYNTSQIYYANSSDNGTSWSVNTSFINGTYGNTRYYPHISCDGNNITVAYEDSTLDDLMVAISTDNGATWTWRNPVTSSVATNVVVERRGNRIYIVYQDASTDMLIRFINSTNGGTTWGAIKTLITPASGYDMGVPSIAVDGSGGASDKIYVTATNNTAGGGNEDIYFVNSTNSGVTFGTIINIMSTGIGSKYYSSITFNGSNIYVVNHDQTNYDIYFTNSTNSGITWTTDYRLDLLGVTVNRARFASITVDSNGYPRAFWYQNATNVNYDIVYRSYNGTAWNDTVTYLTNNNFGNTFVNTPYKYYGDNKIHYIWRNGTASPYQIMYDFISLDTTPPTYSLNSTNSTLAGTPVSHNLKWTDETGLSGYIFSFDNCTGSLVNNSFVSFSGTANWSNVTKTINSTVGCTIQWKVYANDTSNNWNTSLTYSYVTTSAGQQYNQTGSLSMTLASDKYRIYKSVRVKDLTTTFSLSKSRIFNGTRTDSLSFSLSEDGFKQAIFPRVKDLSFSLTEDSSRIYDGKRVLIFPISIVEDGLRKADFQRTKSLSMDLVESALAQALKIYSRLGDLSMTLTTTPSRLLNAIKTGTLSFSLTEDSFKSGILKRAGTLSFSLSESVESSLQKFYSRLVSLSMSLTGTPSKIGEFERTKSLSFSLSEDSFKKFQRNIEKSLSLTLSEDSLRSYVANRLGSLSIALTEQGLGSLVGGMITKLASLLISLTENAKAYISAWEEVSPYRICSVLQQVEDSPFYLCIYDDGTWKILIKGL